jgi:nanoRNase/pAp phosphatase (c-di-AMP/oligoRNAs hydrolase)
MVQPSPRQALEQVLRAAAGEPLVILLSGHPDPDAIGSALAHQRLCAEANVPATIAHVLGIAHRQNRALVKLLGVEMLHIRSGAELSRFKHLSLVDTCQVEPSVDLPLGLELLTVVDHHRGVAADAPFVDVRPTLGSCSSIYSEYLAGGFAPLGAGRRDDARVATALFFGIQTDTDDFSLATGGDFTAAAYLRGHVDLDVLKRIGRRVVSAAAMAVLGRALASLVVVRDFAVAGVGLVAPHDRDTLGAVADHILLREDIDTVLIFGLVGDKIDGSLRTNNPSVDPALFLATAFGTADDGRPYGGGRADKGGFQIPLGMLAEGASQPLYALVEEVVFRRLARVVPDIQREIERQRAPA